MRSRDNRGTDGLTSAYQVTQITSASTAVPDTAGQISIGVISLPSWVQLPETPTPDRYEKESLEPLSRPTRLAARVAQDKLIYELTERGREEIDHGLGVRWEDIKRSIGDV